MAMRYRHETRFGTAQGIQSAVRKLYRERVYAAACTCDPKAEDPCVACHLWDQVGLPTHARPLSEAERGKMTGRSRR